MTDVFSTTGKPPSVGSRVTYPERDAGGWSDDDLRAAIELLYFAYRDFTSDADASLSRYGFGRAHHRVIYFVGRRPGLTAGDLLSILRIKKQSLAPILAHLVRDGFVIQRADLGDRRRRRLYLSPEAESLERALTGRQAELLRKAFGAAGEGAAEGFFAVLREMAGDRARVIEGGR